MTLSNRCVSDKCLFILIDKRSIYDIRLLSNICILQQKENVCHGHSITSRFYPLYDRSVSRQLSAAFVDQWKSLHPGAAVIDRDLNATSLPPISAEWVGAAYTPEAARTPEQKKQLA